MFILLVGIGFTIQAQVVSQDAEGKSTIVFPGGVIGIEPGKTALTFNFMNIQDISKNKGFLWGITARAENKSGIGKLFDSGKVAPGGLVLVTFAYYESSESYVDMAIGEDPNETNLRTLKKQELNNLKKQKKKVQTEKKQLLAQISKEKFSKQFDESLMEVSDVDKKALHGLRKQYWMDTDVLENKLIDLRNKSTNPKLQVAVDNIIRKVKQLLSQLKNKEKELVEITKQLASIKSKGWYERWVLFTRIGGSAGKFKSYTPSESSALKDHFKDIDYSSLSFQIGMNMQLGGGLLLGFAAGFQEANNLANLSKQEFILNTTQTSENQKLVEEEKIIAYSGDFQEFDRLDIDSDIVSFVKVGKSHVMAPYGYFRWRIPLGAGHSFPNTMNVGIGANFFTDKGKHLGGLFLELPDITNELEEDRKLLNRLTLGITLRISFSKSNSWIPWFK